MRFLIAPIALVLAAPGIAQDSPAPTAPAPTLESLSLEQRTSLRCSVGFAIVNRLQGDGSPEGTKYPPLGERGREFFVRSTAKLMEDTGADRAAVGDLVNAQIAELVADEGQLDAILPGCIALLDASGL
ncbi:hypothetical protein [Qipengyuania sp. RANM35]|uniref:hypothetical protein n=1 Tax=Qipengyuania sp. RANM35 TaxID=3068635 RepID=UPI0034DADA37